MSKNIGHLQHIKSNVVIEGKPKLPTAEVLVEGELAVNYAEGYETISLRNSNSGITTFSSDDYYTKMKLGNRFTSTTTVTDAVNNLYAVKSNLHVGTFNANNISEEGWYDAIVLGRPEGSESDEKYLLYHSSNGGQICFSRRNSGKCYQRLGIGHPWMPIAEDDYSLMQSSSAAINNYELSSSFDYADWTPLISEGYTKDDNTRLSEIYAGDTLSVTEAHLIKTVHLHPNDIIRVRVLYRRGFAYEIENYKYDSDAYVYVSKSQNAGHTIDVLKSDFIKVKSLGSLDYVMPSWQDLAFVRDELFTDDKEYGWLYLKTNVEQEGDYYLHIHGDFSSNGSWLLFGEGEVWTPCKYSFEELINNKLGSGFTDSNSANTVTSVIEENKEIVAAALNDLDERKLDASAYTPTDLSNYYTKDETSGATELSDEFALYVNKTEVDQVIDETTSASTNPVSTSAVYSAITENELVWANAYVAMSGAISSHTEDTSIHVTSADKATWDAKLDASDLDDYYEKTETSGATELETAFNGKANTSDIADFFDGVMYELSGTTHVINFYNGNTIKATIDATDFIKDGMIDSVSLETTSGTTYLVITWNTDAGKSQTSLNVGDLFDADNYYTKTEINNKLGSGFTVNSVTEVIEENERVISSSLNDLNTRKLDASAYTPTDLSNYYTKSDTSGATEISNALNDLNTRKLDASAYTPTDLSNYYTKSQTSGATELSTEFTKYYTTAQTSGATELDTAFSNIDDKFGSGFTVSSVTEVIEENEEIVSEALNDLNTRKLDASAYTPTDLSNYYTKSETSASTEIASEFSKLGETVHNVTNVTGAAGGTNLCASWSGECEEITELYDGLNIQIKLPNSGHASGCTISINGGEKHKVILNATTNLTTQYASGSIVRFVYDANQSGAIYTGSSTTTSVTGVWKVSDYNTNTTYTVMPYVYLQNRRYYAGENIYRYMILLSKDESTLIPINTDSGITAGTKTLTTEEFNPFGPILYYSVTATTASGATISSGRTYQQYNVNLAYSFNTTNTLTPYRDVYMVATPQSNGMAKLAPNPITQTLPTTDDGLIYIYLGCAYSSTTIAFTLDHPVYYFKDGKLRLFTSELGSAAYKDVENVIDETVSASTNPVSVGAVFSALAELNQQMEVISSALNDLNGRLAKLEN